MAYSWQNCPEEIKEFVYRILNNTKNIIHDNFIGLYLHGSLAMGGFNPQRSDIDLLVITEDGLEVGTKRSLAQQFLTYSGNSFPIEISFLTIEQLKDFNHPSPFEFHFSEFWRTRYEEELSLQTYNYINGVIREDPDLAAHITITAERGICVEGKPIKDVFPSIHPSLYISSILGDFNECLENIVETPVYCTLNLIRVYIYLSEGIISSKEEAGIWGLKSLPEAMKQTLQKVVANYSAKDGTYEFERNELLTLRDYFAVKVKQLLSN